MIMVPVESSNVESVGFENGTLRVKFKSGGAYDYQNVDAKHFEGIKSDKSPGTYLMKHVKPHHEWSKVSANG